MSPPSPRDNLRRPATVAARAEDRVPLLGRFFPAPVASKVPEVIFLFWVVKILTTAGGEATSDYLKTYGNFGGGGARGRADRVGLVLQFATRRYQAFAYWFFAYAIATTGTGVADFLHLDVHIPYAGTTILWAVMLAAVFWGWQRSEGTLSIHSITTQRREAFYWATVFATFALGTALGDFTATSLGMGYLASGVVFSVVIFFPALGRWRFGLNSIAAFWMSYVVTRPLGASFADWISKPPSMTGIGFGDGPTACYSLWPSSSWSPTWRSFGPTSSPTPASPPKARRRSGSRRATQARRPTPTPSSGAQPLRGSVRLRVSGPSAGQSVLLAVLFSLTRVALRLTVGELPAVSVPATRAAW